MELVSVATLRAAWYRARTVHRVAPSLVIPAACATLIVVGFFVPVVRTHAEETTKAEAKRYGPSPTEPPDAIASAVELRRIARGLDRPVQIVAPPGRPDVLFVVELGGRVKILRDGALVDRTFTDFSKRVAMDHRARGLQSLAFHPDFASNGRLFVNWTGLPDGATEIFEFRVDPNDPDRIDEQSERLILRIPQPHAHHNGGDLQFGPDGRLYTAMGDGGNAGTSQAPKKRLGKLLRIDVDSPEPGVELVQKGLRNPWRFSFDRATGDLYLPEIGQSTWEAVYVWAAEDIDGHNLGWPFYEAGHCTFPKVCERLEVPQPAVDYHHHEAGCSVTGGFVYRGAAIPSLDGAYFYADWCTGMVRSFRWSATEGVRDHWEWRPHLDPKSQLATLVSFGQDTRGELYLVSHDGDIWMLAPKHPVDPAPAAAVR